MELKSVEDTSWLQLFIKNSRYSLVCVPHTKLPSHGARLSRSYASKLPSSFSIVLSSAWVYSTWPPVSVSGTDCTRGLFPGTLLPAPAIQLAGTKIRIRHSPAGPRILTWFPSTTHVCLVLGAG